MVLKLFSKKTISRVWFENDVKKYGTQTNENVILRTDAFENDVKKYGTQTFLPLSYST